MAECCVYFLPVHILDSWSLSQGQSIDQSNLPLTSDFKDLIDHTKPCQSLILFLSNFRLPSGSVCLLLKPV